MLTSFIDPCVNDLNIIIKITIYFNDIGKGLLSAILLT